LIDGQGDILTNYHVIEGANPMSGVTAQFEDNVTRQAKVIGSEPDNDLAVLKVDLSGLPSVHPLALGDSTTVRVGDPTLAIGNPFGLDRTLTSGIVSALQRQIQAPTGFSIDNVIQTDAPINPGNSGGPLLDAAGRVIGINSQIETGGEGGQGSVGIAFAVPVDTAKEFLPRLEHAAHAELAYIGFTGAPAPAPRHGVVILTTQSGGAAANAGLRSGDDVVSIAGHPVATMSDVQHVVEAHAPGQTVSVRLRRAHGARTFGVRLGSRPALMAH
jgi:putative serine protease PepD